MEAPLNLIIFISVKIPNGNNIGLKDVSICGMSGNNTAEQQFKYFQPTQEVKISSNSKIGSLFIVDHTIKDNLQRSITNVDRTPVSE